MILNWFRSQSKEIKKKTSAAILTSTREKGLTECVKWSVSDLLKKVLISQNFETQQSMSTVLYCQLLFKSYIALTMVLYL